MRATSPDKGNGHRRPRSAVEQQSIATHETRNDEPQRAPEGVGVPLARTVRRAPIQSRLRSLSREPLDREPANAGSDAEDRTGKGLRSPLVGGEALGGGRDVEVVQSRASETATRDVRGRQPNGADHRPIGVVPTNAPAAPQRDPDAALGIHGEPVRDPILGGDGRERAPARTGRLTRTSTSNTSIRPVLVST